MTETSGAAWLLHGPRHWARVERNGVHLARVAGMDNLLVRLFAVLHDCMRENEGGDPGHGSRAAEYAEAIRAHLPPLTDELFDLLCFACRFHTGEIHTESEIVGICWDADRLDLGRVGMIPDADYLNSAEAKRIATESDFAVLEQTEVRNPARYRG